MIGTVRAAAQEYRSLKHALANQDKSKPQLGLPDFNLTAHERIVLRAAQHFLETQLLTGHGTILSIEETEALDEGWTNSVLQMVRAIRFEADDRPAD